MKIERSAKGKVGCILCNPISNKRWFRIYNGKGQSHSDYKILVKEFKVKIIDESVSLFDDDEPRLSWTNHKLEAGESPARGIDGYIFRSDWDTDDWMFRVYDWDTDDIDFEDYKILAEDIQIEVLDESISLYKGKIDYSSKILGN